MLIIDACCVSCHTLQVARGIHTRLYARAFICVQADDTACVVLGLGQQSMNACACMLCTMCIFVVPVRRMRTAGTRRRRLAYVVLDACMASQLVTLRVLRALREAYGDVYSARNVVLAGTHTHASPGGMLQYLLYQMTSLGWVHDSYQSMVDGIVEARTVVMK